MAASAAVFGASLIVTRNERDYRGSPIPAITPVGFSKRIST
jgi:hypothetical protein